MCPAWTQGGRWRRDPGCAAASQAFGFPGALRPAFRATHQHLRRQSRTRRRFIADIDCPERPANRQQVLRIVDFLVTQELCPGSVGRIGEIVSQLAGRVPSSSGLRRIFPEERETGVRVAEGNHVAGDDPRAAARSRTCRGPASSGSQSPSSNRAGVLPSSILRGRWNQRRIPTSL